jgi:AraC-like DNA-binding protein
MAASSAPIIASGRRYRHARRRISFALERRWLVAKRSDPPSKHGGALATRTVPATRLLEALQDPRARVEVAQAGRERLPEGWVVKPRAIPEHLAYLVEQSTLHGRVAGRRLRIDAGGLVWVMPGVLHEFWQDPAAPRPTQYHLKVAVGASGGAAPRTARDAVVVGDATALAPSFAEVVREWRSEREFAGARLRAALTLLLSGAWRLAGEGVDGATLDPRQRERLARFAHRHLGDRIAPSALAAELGLNADYFARVFRRSYGVAPRAWLVRERMRVAAARLRERDEDISTVAGGLGYPDVFLFSRQFKQVHGMSPTEHRRER